LAGIIQGGVKYFAQICYNGNDSCVQFTENELPSRLLRFLLFQVDGTCADKTIWIRSFVTVSETACPEFRQPALNAPNFWGERE
jgi:hypothetical protein